MSYREPEEVCPDCRRGWLEAAVHCMVYGVEKIRVETVACRCILGQRCGLATNAAGIRVTLTHQEWRERLYALPPCSRDLVKADDGRWYSRDNQLAHGFVELFITSEDKPRLELHERIGVDAAERLRSQPSRYSGTLVLDLGRRAG
jgi:hypothetical protein